MIMAAADGKLEIVSHLLQAGANTELRGNQGLTAIEVAKSLGRNEVVSLLSERSR